MCAAVPDAEVVGRGRAAGYEVYLCDLCFGLADRTGEGKSGSRVTRMPHPSPPHQRSWRGPRFVMRLRRMGHPAQLGNPASLLPSCCGCRHWCAYCRTIVPGRTWVGALTLVLGRLVESLSETIFMLLAS